jgi:anti-sigma factor RsiW
LQDYISGRLSTTRQAEIAGILIDDPDAAEKVMRLRQRRDALRKLGARANSLPEQVAAAIGQAAPAEAIIRPDARQHRMLAAAVVGALLLGGGVGWMIRLGSEQGTFVERGLVDTQVTGAFNTLATDYPIQFPLEREHDFDGWTQRAFGAQMVPPPLEDLDYRHVGAGLHPASGTGTAYFIYQSPAHGRLAVIFWRDPAPPAEVVEARSAPNVASKTWTQAGFGFAVLGETDPPRVEAVAQRAATYFRSTLPAP